MESVCVCVLYYLEGMLFSLSYGEMLLHTQLVESERL